MPVELFQIGELLWFHIVYYPEILVSTTSSSSTSGFYSVIKKDYSTALCFYFFSMYKEPFGYNTKVGGEGKYCFTVYVL